MVLLFGDEIINVIDNEVQIIDESICLISAFCKLSVLQHIESKTSEKIRNKKLLVRFRLEDITAGVTDLDIYDFCTENGWDLYFNLDLHAKMYIFDSVKCLVGSANLTQKGLNMTSNSNIEVMSLIELENDDIFKVKQLFDKSVQINDSIFTEMKYQLSSVCYDNSIVPTWGENITCLFHDTGTILYGRDFPSTFSYTELISKPIAFLNLGSNWTIEELKSSFVLSNSYFWLRSQLIKNGGELFFGDITSKLHDYLINEKLYRSEIKTLLSNLINWIIELDIKEISIDRPGYSQRLRLESK